MRERFGVSISDADRGVITWGQYGALIEALAADPTSRLAAVLNGWPHRLTLDWLLSGLLEATTADRFEVRWPWGQKDDPPAVTDADRAAAEADLRERWRL